MGSSSIPQYLSAARQVHYMYTGTQVPTYPLVEHVLRAYSKWEEANFPKEDVRCGVAAHDMLRVWHCGMETQSLIELRDCAALNFSYIQNGLWESSVMSALENKVWFVGQSLFGRVSI